MARRGLSVCVGVVTVLLLVSMVQEVQAQNRRGGGMRMMGGQGVNPLGLVGNAAVQKDLGVSEDKADKLKDISGDVRQEFMEEIQGAGIDMRGAQDLQGEEREKKMAENRAKMAEIQKTINDKFMPKLAEILDKTQMTRLHEIAIQQAGPSALKDAGVVKDLGLSKEQQDKIAAIEKDFSGKLRGLSGAERFTKMAELRDEEMAKSTEVLTKDQQAKFTELKGKAFDLKTLRPQGRGRRGRGQKTDDK
jgi:hypothetical protein